MNDRKALLLGATGLVGSHLLRLLLEEKTYSKVIAPTRRPLDVTGDGSERLEDFSFDFSDWNEMQRRLPVDDVFCCLGTTIKKAGSQDAFRRVDYEYPLELARRAAQSGCKRYLIVTALGADAKSMIFYNRVKGEIENAVQELSFEAVHILRPSLLLGDRGEKRLGEEIATVASGLVAWTLIGPARKYRPIQGAAVARAMRSLALEGDAGRFIHESDAIQAIVDRD